MTVLGFKQCRRAGDKGKDMGNRELLTYSRVGAFKQCPRKEWFRYELGLVPSVDAAALRFGTFWHLLMQAVYRLQQDLSAHQAPPPWEDVAEWLLYGDAPAWAAAAAKIPDHGIVDTWRGQQLAERVPSMEDPSGSRPAHDETEVVNMVALATDMLQRYLARYWDEDLTTWEVLGVEVLLESPLYTPKQQPSTKWRVGGKADVLARSRITGKVWVWDHKTHSGDPSSAKEDGRIDPQGEGYLAMALEMGLYVLDELGGVLHRIARKSVPSVPGRNKCTGKKADGVVADSHAQCALCHGTGEGPLSAAQCDTTPEVYEAALEQTQADGWQPTEKHLGILHALRARGTDPWFQTHTKAISPADLSFWWSETYTISLAKNAAQQRGERGHWRAGDKRTCRLYSRNCEYMALCELNAADSRQAWDENFGLQELYLLRSAHVELDPDAD